MKSENITVSLPTETIRLADEKHAQFDIGLLGDLTAQPSDNSGTQQPQEVA